MKYVDYREKLGLGFNNNEKTEMLSNKVVGFLRKVRDGFSINDYFNKYTFFYYFQEVGEQQIVNDEFEAVIRSISREKDSRGIISKFIVLINNSKTDAKEKLIDLLLVYLDDLHIPYEVITDEDGYFIFSKGAKELDDALVSEPFEWLKNYPKTRSEWIDALKLYSSLSDNSASDVADKFRKALERFFQEFFGKTKSLENLKSEYGAYLKAQGVPSEISNNFEALQKSYTDFMNNYAKHHNKTSRNVLEYIMYQTGNIIRLLITLKQEENNNAD